MPDIVVMKTKIMHKVLAHHKPLKWQLLKLMNKTTENGITPPSLKAALVFWTGVVMGNEEAEVGQVGALRA